MKDKNGIGKILLDTSTLHCSHSFMSRGEFLSLNTERFYYSLKKQSSGSEKCLAFGLINLIESLILYDKIIVDGRTVGRDERSKEIVEHFNDLIEQKTIETSREIELYENSLNCLLKGSKEFGNIDIPDDLDYSLALGHLERNIERIEISETPHGMGNLFRLDIPNDSLFLKTFLSKLYKSNFVFGNKEINDWWYCHDEDKMYRNKVFALKAMPRMSILLHMIRTLYYWDLAKMFGVGYVPHPIRYSMWKEKKPLKYIDLRRDFTDYIDDNVRKKTFDVSSEIIKSINFELIVPMVSNYILNKVEGGKTSLVETIKNVRCMPEAKAFREWCGEIERSFYIDNNQQIIFEATNEIKKITKSWSKSLSVGEKYKDIEVTLWFIKVPISIPQIKRKHHLMFLHKLASTI